MSDEERYGISELADAADVSVRTVRYYIAEGLLPPPVTAGARSYYTREHLDRLKVIGQLKDAFLPLKEIRRHLAQIDGRELHSLADRIKAEVDAVVKRPGFPFITDFDLKEPSIDEDFIHGHEDIRSAPPRKRNRPPEAPPPPSQPSSASSYIARVLGKQQSEAAAPPAPPAPRPAPAPPPTTMQADDPAWRRVRISDDAELLIRDDAYQRRRDKIDWLVDWARKVLE